MTQTTLDTSAASVYAILLTLRWGDGYRTSRGYARSDKDIVIGTSRWEALPEMEIVLPKITGGLDPQECQITTKQVHPIDKLVVGLWSPCLVEIEEVEVSDPENTRRTLFFGPLNRVVKNPDGQSNAARLICFELKKQAEKTLGIVANIECSWNFGDKNCCLDLAGLRQTATVESIDGLDLTVSGLTEPRSNYWLRGYVTFNGLKIMIRDYSGGTLSLTNKPPADWDGEEISVFPGCLKTLEACQGWNNEIRFGGIGLAIPPYHPNFETQ